ncbi:ATP-binding protein [Kitasatospora sp. NPDC049285]|uniref:ATP-binding protein n=1 Tax=Kitasatospora sp. NPDC049285 TaxID=3157096 RepID=UPI0034420972
MGQPADGVRPRSGELVSGERLVAVGGPEGSEARHCPDDWLPAPRRIRGMVQARPELGPSSAVGPLALGGGSDSRLLDREADIATLLARLAEGRSIRLLGQPGSGRSALLAAVAETAGEVAPDGVVRLSGYRRSAADLLQDLFAATHHAPDFRPDREQLTELLAGVAAVVVIDDVEPTGEELEALLAMAPECAFLIAPAADSTPMSPGSRLQDHLVAGLSRPASLTLAARLAGRSLDDAERAWAVDLWFESEGLPLRFVRAAALLRQRDVAVDALVAAQEDRRDVFGSVRSYELPDDPAELENELRRQVPLPSVGESASPAVRLAEGLSEPARRVLRLALALGGECPTAPHLPALVDVGLGESALQELVEAGLAISVGGHHRLTEGVVEALTEPRPGGQQGEGRGAFAPGTIAHGAAEHLSWWVGHASVSTAQVAAEAEVIVAVLLADRDAGRPEAVLHLARAAAPALALSLRWSAWERTLQLGLEAARNLGADFEQAWFHHELGVYALCSGSSQRAAAELEAAVALRAAAGEPRAGAARRMLDLIRAEELAPLAIGPGEEPARKRRSIRAIAQVPYRLRKSRTRGDTRRTVIAASAAVMALGVLGTAIGLSVDRTGNPAGGSHPGRSIEDGLTPAEIPDSPHPSSASPSPSAADSSTAASETPADTPSGSAGSTRKPSATPKTTPPAAPTTTKPGATPTQPAPTSTAPTPPTSSPSESPSGSASATATGSATASTTPTT